VSGGQQQYDELQRRWRESSADPALALELSVLSQRLGQPDNAQLWAKRAARLQPRAAFRQLLETELEIFALPQGRDVSIATIDERGELLPLEMGPRDSQAELRLQHGFYRVGSGPGLELYELGQSQPVIHVLAPTGPIHAWLVTREALIVGAEADDRGPWLAWMPIQEARSPAPASWRRIPLRLEGKFFPVRKAIDALSLVGDRLLAWDNIVLPKFVFELDFSQGIEAARQSRCAMLGSHYTYERIRNAACGDGYAALFSVGGGRAGPGYMISLYDLDELQERTWAGHVVDHWNLGEQPLGISWHHVDIAEGRVLISAGHAGLLWASIKALCEAESRPFPLDLLQPFRADIPAGDQVLAARGLGGDRVLVVVQDHLDNTRRYARTLSLPESL
jgi:hypothetical protein